jgi:hypothetical protein
MSTKDTINKAYGHVPKEPQLVLDMTWIPSWRGIKYYWYKLIRKVTR